MASRVDQILKERKTTSSAGSVSQSANSTSRVNQILKEKRQKEYETKQYALDSKREGEQAYYDYLSRSAENLQAHNNELRQSKSTQETTGTNSGTTLPNVVETTSTPFSFVDYGTTVGKTASKLKWYKDNNIVTEYDASNPSGMSGFKTKYADEIAKTEAELQDAKAYLYLSKAEKYENLSANPDYAEKSKIIDESISKGFGRDDNYSYINDINNRRFKGMAQGDGQDANRNAGRFDEMTQDQIDNYNYLYQTEGKDSAEDYLSYLEVTLDEKRMEKYRQNMVDLANGDTWYANPFIASAISVPANLISGVGLADVAIQNARNKNGEWKPLNYNSPAMNATNAVTATRGTVAENVSKWAANTAITDENGVINIDPEDHKFLARIFNGRSLGDIYQLGMSMIDSSATAILGTGLGKLGGLGTILLGGAAGSQGVLDALANGATDEQALKMGLANGLFEALFEFVSLDKLINGDAKGIIKAFLQQGGIEASEEMFTTIANDLAEATIMAEKSDWQKNIQEYIDDGYSEEEAKTKAFWDAAIGVIWDGIGGFFSGGISAAGKTTINNYIVEPAAYSETYGSDIDALVAESLEILPDNALAKKIQSKLDAGKNVRGSQIRNLVNQNEANILANDKTAIQNAAEQQLTSYGETGDVKAIAQSITKYVAGEKLTQTDRRNIFQSKYGQRVVNELNPENIKSGDYNTQWSEKLDTNRINPEEYSKLVQEAQIEPESVSTEQTSNNTPMPSIAQQESTDSTQTLAQDINVPNSATDTNVGSKQPESNTSEKLTSSEIPNNSKSNTPTVTPTVSETGKTVTVEDASKKYGAQAGAFVHTYQNGQDVQKFDDAYSSAYDYGKSAVPFETVKGLDSVSYLTEKQRELAYEAGKAAADTDANTKQQERMQRANGKTGRRTGAVKGEGVTIADLKDTFNDQQGRAYRVLSTIAEATGIDIVLYRSSAGEDGKFRDAQGKFKHANPDTIYIDLNSGLSNIKDVSDFAKYAMLRTFSHEFTHFVEYWNPVQYNELRKVVFNELTARGENVNDLIEAKIDETGLSYEKASREVVAEAMTDILPDSKFVQNMAENHKRLFNKLLEKLKEFVADLREYFDTIGKNRSREAEALKEQVGETIKYIDSVINIFDKAAEGAVDNFQNAYAVDEAVAENETTEQVTGKLENADAATVTEEVTAENQEASQVETSEPKTTTSKYGYTITDNPKYNSVEVKFDEMPSETVRNALKALKFRWNGKTGVWYGKATQEHVLDVLDSVYAAEEKTQIVPETTNVETVEVAPVVAEAETTSDERPAEIPEEATVKEIIETIQEESVNEEIPPKAETEEAKKELKKAVKMPIQGTNEAAMFRGIETGELSIDSVTLPGKVDGFNVEQRAFLVKNLIEGVYTDSDTIKIDVPFDGKFEVNNTPSSVVAILGRLKVKVTQEIMFDMKLDALIKKSKVNKVVKYGDQWFMVAGNFAVAIDEAAKDYAMSNDGYKSEIGQPAEIVNNILTGEGKSVDTVAYETKDGFIITSGDEKLLVPKDLFQYFRKNAFESVTLYYMSGKTTNTIRVKDASGNIVGLAIVKQINNTDINLAQYKTVKINTVDKTTSTPASPNKIKEENTNGRHEESETIKQEPQPKTRFPSTQMKNGTPSEKTAYSILTDYLRAGKQLTSKDLYAICDEAFGGTQAEGKYNRKDAYDAMELAVNKYLVETMAKYNTGTVENALEGLRKMQSILELLPTQNVRTEEQQQYQQFSTPPNIAYLAAWAANINNTDSVLEPSAGIGGLASFAKAWGAEVTVNELSKRRLEVLRAMGFDNVFNENAEQIDNILPDRIQPSVVIMNPPFSATAGRTASNKTSNAERHIDQALERLAVGGRLVTILGRGMSDSAYYKYWDKVRENYNIRANISIDGENYKKYGTTFDVQIVVIDKTGPQGNAKTLTGSYKDLAQIPEIMEGIRNDRNSEIKRNTIVNGNQVNNVPVSAKGNQSVSVPVDKADNSTDGSMERGNRANSRRTGEHGSVDIQSGQQDVVSAVDRDDKSGVRAERNTGANQENTEVQNGGGTVSTDNNTVGNADSKRSEQRSRVNTESTRSGEVEEGRSKERNDDGVFADYVAPAITVSGSKTHPAVLVESSAMSAVSMPKATYVPHLPENVIKNSLSTEQLVSITYAGQAHEQKLPSGQRKGFFIGDGTGVGKGRQISGIILDNFEQGRNKAVWISMNASLFPDAVRDWTDTTGRSKDEVHDFSKIKLQDKIDYKDGILYTTYDTLRTEKNNMSRLKQIVDWLGKDFDGVIAFDEAHNMGNLLGKSSNRGKTKGSAKAAAAVELQNMLPNARVVYVSATAATEVEGLAFASRLGLWGRGTAFQDVNDFISNIGSSGLAAMELVIRDMKAMGVYVARSISYNGVNYDTVQHNLDPVQTIIYDTMSEAWQKTMTNVEASLESTGGKYNSQARALAIGQYYSAMQRFYNQVLTSMSMPSVIADMRKELAAGRSCVLQIVNTNQAEADRQIADIKANNGSLEDMDLTPRGTLIGYLENCYPVIQYEEYTDDQGNLRSRPVIDSQGNPVIDKAAVRKRDALIEEIQQMSIPDGPLEMLFNAFGTDQVSEITGRTRRVVPRKMPDGTIQRVEESRTKNSTAADVEAFQNGKKRILIFSDAGGTGKSYHASRTAKNQQQRVHYVLQPGWIASKAVQGFGRTHRSNQASAPIYKLVTTNIKGQKRFTSTIARRLDQLGALTKGQRDTGSGMFGPKDNLETDLARDSLREFYRRLGKNQIEGLDGKETIKRLGLTSKFTDQYGAFKLDDATSRDISTFLNRILALKVDEQNTVFDAFINIYETLLEEAINAGTLDTGMENVNADKIEIIDDKVIKEQESTGATTHYVQAKVYTKPKLITTVNQASKVRAGFQGIYKTKTGEIKAVYRIADKTTEWGAVEKQYRLCGPNYAKYSIWKGSTFEKNAELVPKEDWQGEWDKEIAKVPEYNEETKHMLTGTLLPIWNALPTDGNTKVQRLISDDGRAYLGRVINQDQIDDVLRRFNLNRTKETFTAKGVMDDAIKKGVHYKLSYQRAEIFRSRVSGEWRLEYSQIQNAWAIKRQYPDMMSERINYRDRHFIPLNDKGAAMLEKILEDNPVASTSEDVDDGTQYQSRNFLEDNDTYNEYDEEIQYSKRVDDTKTLKMLNEQLKKGEYDPVNNPDGGYIKVYRSAQIIDGGMYAPMNAVDRDENGKNKTLGYRSEFRQWEMSTESPEIAQKYMDKNPNAPYAKFNLDGVDNKTDNVAYNPYIHLSNLVLNDQFAAAYRRNLVTVEYYVPVSEIGAYKAKYAKDGTGWVEWKPGGVAGKLMKAKPEYTRRLFVSRYAYPVRIVPSSEVASMYKEYLDGTNIKVPWNVVTPELRKELVNAGVDIDYKDVYSSTDKKTGVKKYLKFTDVFPGEETQLQQRTSPMTDREILSIAASEVNVSDLSDGEKDALRIFQQRLTALYDLEQKRAEEGRLYKEQQFGTMVDREAAKQTLNRMHVLDQQIMKAGAEVLKVERAEVLKRVLQKARKVVETQEREHSQELLGRYRDRQKNSAAIKKYKERIKTDTDSLTKWILHPSNKNALQRVPDALKNSIIPFLTSIDFTSKQQLRGGAATQADKEFMKQLTKLKAAIKQNIDVQGMYSGYNDLPEGFMDEMQKFIDSAQVLADSQEGQFVINRMTSEELKTLSKLVRVVKKLIVNMNAFHQNAMFQHTYEAGDSSIDFMSKIEKPASTGAVSEFLLWQQMRPAYAFERFGEGGRAIFDEFRRGQATLAFNTVKITEFANKTYTDAEVKAWEKQTKTFNLGGDKVTIPVSYLMGLYELSKRPQALGHLLGAGLRVATYMNGKEKISDVGHALTPGDISTMIKALTPRQKEVADSLQKFMAEQGGKWGNYVSVARFGEELFGEVHYYPINSDGRHLQATADEHPSAASLYALLNMSFTKELTEEANNRIILYSIFDVFSNHMASMAQYNAFALPILDSLKWFNYQQVEKNEDGSKTILGSVREEMDRAYGTPEETRPGKGRSGYAESFVMNIIKAFNGTETQGIPTDKQGLNAMHKYNMAQVAYNFRVVVQQPLAITRAGMLISYGNIIKGMSLSPAKIKANIAEMQKYSGIAAWKALGFYDVNISRGLTDIIKHNKTAIDKIGDVGMAGAEFADTITWAAMWSACKEEVISKQHIKPGNEGFYEAVTKLFEDVVYKTQVVDSVLTKNEFLRSKGAWARLIGSFMSEPTTTASMLIDAYDKYSMDLQRGLSRQQAWKNNGKNIVRTAYVYAIGSLLLAAVTAAADAWRDDDDYQTFLQKWCEAFVGNLLDEANPLNKLPILRDFYELVKSVLGAWGVDTYGNESRSVIFQWRDYLVKASEIFHDKITGEETNYTWYGGAFKLLQALSGMTGLPMAGATRELNSAWNNIIGAMAPSLKLKTYDPGEKNSIKYAYQDGYLTDEQATNLLISTGEAESENEAYWIVKEWETGSSKYADLENAIRANDSKAFSEATSELIAYGSETDTVSSKARSIVRDMFFGTEKKPASIDANEAVDLLVRYGEMTKADAQDKVDAWVFQTEYPDLEWSEATITKYNDKLAPVGISVETYAEYLDKKEAGGSKKEQVLAIIHSLKIKASQKDALYYSEGYAKSTIDEAPWH